MDFLTLFKKGFIYFVIFASKGWEEKGEKHRKQSDLQPQIGRAHV